MTLSITVEALGGEPIESAAQECVDLATKLNVIVVMPFNGVHCTAHPHGVAQQMVDEFYKVSAQGYAGLKMATARLPT